MLEDYFSTYRNNIIGIDKTFQSPFGEQRIVYADWTASGRNYAPIENLLKDEIMPFVGNTHTETNITGSSMTIAYHKAQQIIKQHVNAGDDDIIISTNSGMTGVVNKFQRILGLKIHEKYKDAINIPEEERPVVFVSHMEHHSNQTSWLETIADVEIIQPDSDMLVDLEHLEHLLEKYKNRKTKIAAVTSCSNVTGISTPYPQIAEVMHWAGGLCFVDFACSAPYININMHPEDELQQLDAIYFSPHKFLGGPGSAGVVIFNKELYDNEIPDNPGGGTVDWTNPWGDHKYIDDIEAREDGGTPAFLQTIKTALCIKLKEEMGVSNMIKREREIIDIMWEGMTTTPNLHLLADNVQKRLGVLSFYIDGLHYNLGVKILNDRFGIQVRGGCSCAGTYGHYLLNVEQVVSEEITSCITQGDMSNKPGWIRLSIHPTTSNEEANYMVDCLKQLAANHPQWTKDYAYNPANNEFSYKDNSYAHSVEDRAQGWFNQLSVKEKQA
jgi:selenocysteine lyase/cysteine desulfurase